MIYSAVVCSVIVGLLGAASGMAALVGWRQSRDAKETRESIIAAGFGGIMFSLGAWATACQLVAA